MKALINVTGAVQGVGYRPFVLRKATEYSLKGYVKNLGAYVEILAIGTETDVLSFSNFLKENGPSGSIILSVNTTVIDKNSNEDSSYNGYEYNDFRIIESDTENLGDSLPVFLPDIGICDDCLNEMLDENDRRYRYPLISCASCGSRISILNRLPYDRDTTTMDTFKMCPKCASEYKNGRRLHAQTISCHDCGPQYELDSSNKDVVSRAIKLLNEEKIIGLKGISGYQIVGKPTDNVAKKIRQIKGRENKPFAVMFSDIDEVKKYCRVNTKEEELLKSYARPIVLLERLKDFPYEVCKDSRYIGAFLPSAGFHRLLCDGAGPLIVTSANISDEPIIISEDAFIDKFKNRIERYNDKSEGISGVLSHKRIINIPQDDSVLFVTEIENNNFLSSFVRRSRGYVPLPVIVKNSGLSDKSVLAFGGDLKSTFSFGKKDRIIPSPYIGDLKDFETKKNFGTIFNNLSIIFEFSADKVVCDMHPFYESNLMAKAYSKSHNLTLFEVQHHHAHILSVMAEKSLNSSIGIAFDGTGYGNDGKIWGGEVLYCNNTSFDRVGHLSYVKLCGGDNAPKNAKQVKECYRYAADNNDDKVSQIVKAALINNIATYETSSVGRLFDAVCSLLEIKDENSFEGECAIALENAAWDYVKETDIEKKENEDIFDKIALPVIEKETGYLLDQISLFDVISKLYETGKYSRNLLAYAFHIAIINAVVDICDIVRRKTGENKVCLSGGVFANRLLLKEIYKKLKDTGFEVYVNELVPSGDAGISLGQAYYGMLLE